MTIRQEKFEAERQKMLAQMGMDEEQVEVESEVESPIEFDSSGSEIIEVDDEFTEAAQALINEYDEDVDAYLENPEEYEEKERIQNRHHNAVARRLKNKGPVKVGHFKKYLDNFQMSWGGKGMWFPVLLVILPFSLYTAWEHNIVCGLVMFGYTYSIARVFAFSLSVSFIPWVLQNEMKKGPKYLVDIRKGWSKRIFSILSPMMNLIANFPIIFIAIFTIIWFGLAGYFFRVSIYQDLPFGPFIWLTIAGAHGLITWIVIYSISYGIYTWFAELTIGVSDHTIYNLRYLHSPCRVMIAKAKSKGIGFVSIDERIEAFFRDYEGAV